MTATPHLSKIMATSARKSLHIHGTSMKLERQRRESFSRRSDTSNASSVRSLGASKRNFLVGLSTPRGTAILFSWARTDRTYLCNTVEGVDQSSFGVVCVKVLLPATEKFLLSEFEKIFLVLSLSVLRVTVSPDFFSGLHLNPPFD